ncbi:MAG: hypothetical protein IJG83_07140, partial [Thermoguttaceae bacterium]|nr:hypothetical protein [Thermoguttaceae bacterium]
LADRTCRRIWDEVDHAQRYSSPEDESPSRQPPHSLSTEFSRIIPKIPRLNLPRGSFVPKPMTVYEVDPSSIDSPPVTGRRPAEPIASADKPIPTSISSEPILIPPRPYAAKVMYSKPIEIQRESVTRTTLLYAETLLILSRPSVGIPTLSFAEPSPIAPTRMYSAPLYIESGPFVTSVLYDHPAEVRRCPFRRTVMHKAPLVVQPAPYTIRRMYAEPLTVSEPQYSRVHQYDQPLEVERCPYRFAEMYGAALAVPAAPFIARRQYDHPLEIEPAPYRFRAMYDRPLTVEPAPYKASVLYDRPLVVSGAPPMPTEMYDRPLEVSSAPYTVREMYDTPLTVAAFAPCKMYDRPLLVSRAPMADSAALAEWKKRISEQQNRPRRRARPRSPLRNGEIREEFRDEYYWELLPEVEPSGTPQERLARTGTPEQTERENVITQAVERIGSTAISEVRQLSEWLGVRPAKSALARPPRDKESWWHPSDLLISVVGGVLIAIVVVLPILRFFGRELAVVIAKSTVRQIGQKVPVNADSAFLEQLPYLSESLIHPQVHEAVLEDPVAPASSLSPTQNAIEILFPDTGLGIENIQPDDYPAGDIPTGN